LRRHRRHSVFIEARNSGHLTQLGYLSTSPILPDVDNTASWGAVAAIGPVQYDLSDGGLRPLMRIEVDTEWLVQGQYIGKDSSCNHNWAEGTLKPFPGVRDVKLPTVTYGPDEEGKASIVSNVVAVGVDGSGVLLDHANIYAIGGYEIVGGNSPFILDHSLFGFVFGDQWHHYSTGWASHTTVSRAETQELLWIRIEKYKLPEEVGEDPWLLHRTITTWGKDTGWVTEEDDISCFFFPTEPVHLVGVDTDMTATRLYAFGKSAIRSIIQRLQSQTLDHGQFLSARECVDAFRILNINGLAFVGDLLKLKDFLVPLIRLFKNPLCLKNWSRLLLWIRYGVKLSIADLISIGHGIKKVRSIAKNLKDYRRRRELLQTRYATLINPILIVEDGNTILEGKNRTNARVCAWPVLPKWVDDLTVMLEDFDLRFSAKNLWDLVPFSFVLDWFVNVTEILSGVDYLRDIDQLRLREFIYTTNNKAVTGKYALFCPEFPFYGSLRLATYDRGVYTKLPPPSWGPGVPTFLKHWWEGILIILSRKGN